ncbi:MAG: patatin-like phospholipase family protein, partial [Bdellovibrionota bacterium]
EIEKSAEEVSSDNSEQEASPVVYRPKKLGVILGPGLVKTYAHLGVLESLERQQIPVQEIVGVGWGAIFAAGYAKEARSSGLKWQIYKVAEDQYPSKSLFGGSYEQLNLNKLDPMLKALFSSKDLKSFEIKFSCPYTMEDNYSPKSVSSGLARAEIKRCLGGNAFYKAYRKSVWDPLQIDGLVKEMRKRGIERVLVVNVLSEDDYKSSSKVVANHSEKYLWGKTDRLMDKIGNEADYYLQVNTRSKDFSDFKENRDFERKGSSAMSSIVDRISQDVLGR